jgi:hypothetical protein
MPEANIMGMKVWYENDPEDKFLYFRSDQRTQKTALTYLECAELCRTILDGLDAKHDKQGKVHRLIQSADTALINLERELRQK